MPLKLKTCANGSCFSSFSAMIKLLHRSSSWSRIYASLQHTARYFSHSSSCFKVACITGEKPLTLYKPSRVLCAPYRGVTPFSSYIYVRRIDVQISHALRQPVSQETSKSPGKSSSECCSSSWSTVKTKKHAPMEVASAPSLP